MKDPFFLEPAPWLAKAAQPLADLLALPTLPLHVHEVIVAALFYSVIYYPISPILSRLFFSQHYSHLTRKKRLNWDAHVVSFVQSTLINALALWVMFVDEERKNMDWEERIWGYTGAAGMIQALAAGYFVWDLVVTSSNLDVFGLGTLAHAVAALAVYALGFRPFVNYYGCIFILWELSTPFLNVHWFCDKLGITGSKIQLYNGLLLISTFFSCRLVYGTYQSVRVFRDIWAALGAHPSPHSALTAAHPQRLATLAFVTEASVVPHWLALSYLASNLTLNGLNFYWFVMMIKAVRKRFVPTQTTAPPAKSEKLAVASGIQVQPGVAVKRGS